jgi:ABC-type transport system involved in multi-copper enzyme maturation permease subunit
MTPAASTPDIHNRENTRSARHQKPSLPGFPAVTLAVAAREMRTLLRNRFAHVFLFLAVAGGFATSGLTPSIQAIPFILLQMTLYLVPLFAILIGLSSAHGELEEQNFLLSQPVPRLALVLGKALTLGCCLGLTLLLAFGPALFFYPRTGALLLLWGLSLLLGGVFLALGLTLGFSTRDRSRGIIYALLAWLVLLIGFDLLAYAAALTPAVDRVPLLWMGVLLMNPVDAVRIAMLFQLEDIPFTVPSELRLVTFWMDHLLAWVTGLCVAWMTLLLLWSWRKVEGRQT